ncbi:hypothetical protein HanPSC8_Chr07g0291271 [Helianthus annuus]|nr:hypothetical protein HanPSC8_Chr07g0291271 [Helianthus annuus]
MVTTKNHVCNLKRKENFKRMCRLDNKGANNYDNAGHSNHKSIIIFSEIIFEL